MLKYRFLPPNDIGKQRHQRHGGRVIHAQPGEVVDVDAIDRGSLSANGWTYLGPVGTTAERPDNPGPSDHFIDTALGEVIFYDGATWRNTNGAAV